MTEHRPTGLLEVYGPQGPFYIGLCSCGWKSGRRRTRKIAGDARDAHIQQPKRRNPR